METQDRWEQTFSEAIAKNKAKIEEFQTLLRELEQETVGLEEAQRAYLEARGREKSTIGYTLTRSEVDGKSQTEILKLLALGNGNSLIAKDAIKAMKNVGVFGNPENADAAVYGLLSRRKEFVRVRPGVYRLELNGASSKRTRSGKNRKATGLGEIVRQLKELNPSASSEEIRDMLINSRYDFQGKSPTSSVNMALARLRIGKSKETGTSNNPQLALVS